jgi:hypothetical protein
MIPYNLVQDFITQNLQGVTIKGMNFQARCPICGDSIKNPRKKRFNLRYDDASSIYWNCFNCGKSGTFIDLYAHIKGINTKEAYRLIKRQSFKDLGNAFVKSRKIVKPSVHKGEHFNELRKDWIGANDEPKSVVQSAFKARLVVFMNKRCLPKSYPFYIAWGGCYKGRIIIPVFDGDNNIVYFQARSLEARPAQKYMNPDLTSKKVIIFNGHKFSRDQYIVVTEGPIDALCVGDQGTCCFGSSVDDVFLGKLLELTDKGVVIALDNDEEGQHGIKKIMAKSRYAKSLRYFNMPYEDIKDLNQMVIDRPVDDLYKFVITNSYNHLEYVVREKVDR